MNFYKRKNFQERRQAYGKPETMWMKQKDGTTFHPIFASSFQFYNSISTVSFVLFLSAKSYHILPHRLVCLPLWKYDHSIIVSAHTGSLLAYSQATAGVTADNTEQSACDQLHWYSLILPTDQSKQSNCLWHTLWPNCTDCKKVTCMALRGLPFGTMVTPHSVEVWQVVEEKK